MYFVWESAYDNELSQWIEADCSIAHGPLPIHSAGLTQPIYEVKPIKMTAMMPGLL